MIDQRTAETIKRAIVSFIKKKPKGDPYGFHQSLKQNDSQGINRFFDKLGFDAIPPIIKAHVKNGIAIYRHTFNILLESKAKGVPVQNITQADVFTYCSEIKDTILNGTAGYEIRRWFNELEILVAELLLDPKNLNIAPWLREAIGKDEAGNYLLDRAYEELNGEGRNIKTVVNDSLISAYLVTIGEYLTNILKQKDESNLSISFLNIFNALNENVGCTDVMTNVMRIKKYAESRVRAEVKNIAMDTTRQEIVNGVLAGLTVMQKEYDLNVDMAQSLINAAVSKLVQNGSRITMFENSRSPILVEAMRSEYNEQSIRQQMKDRSRLDITLTIASSNTNTNTKSRPEPEQSMGFVTAIKSIWIAIKDCIAKVKQFLSISSKSEYTDTSDENYSAGSESGSDSSESADTDTSDEEYDSAGSDNNSDSKGTPKTQDVHNSSTKVTAKLLGGTPFIPAQNNPTVTLSPSFSTSSKSRGCSSFLLLWWKVITPCKDDFRKSDTYAHSSTTPSSNK